MRITIVVLNSYNKYYTLNANAMLLELVKLITLLLTINLISDLAR